MLPPSTGMRSRRSGRPSSIGNDYVGSGGRTSLLVATGRPIRRRPTVMTPSPMRRLPCSARRTRMCLTGPIAAPSSRRKWTALSNAAANKRAALRGGEGRHLLLRLRYPAFPEYRERFASNLKKGCRASRSPRTSSRSAARAANSPTCTSITKRSSPGPQSRGRRRFRQPWQDREDEVREVQEVRG